MPGNQPAAGLAAEGWHSGHGRIRRKPCSSRISRIREIGSQSGFLTRDGDRVDRIFRYEDIEAFTHFLEDRLDCAISLPRVNVPPAVDVSLDEPQETRLRQVMERDVALYDSL